MVATRSRLKCSGFWPTCEHQGMQLGLADYPADFAEGEERHQCYGKDDPHKNHVGRTSAADAGDALADRLALEYSDNHFLHDVED